MKNTFLLCIFISLFVCCAPHQPPGIHHLDYPGFWTGLWHGCISPFTFLISLFSDNIRIYAFPNSGKWYDFGFMLGIGGFSGFSYKASRK